jgi:hypothetical protein
VALLKGFGLCGICLEQIEDPTPPLRPYTGGTMAHKTCFDKQKAYEQTDEYQVDEAKKGLAYAQGQYNQAANNLLTAKNKLARLLGVSVDAID